METNEGQMTENSSEVNLQTLSENPVSIEKQIPQSVVNRIVAEVKQTTYKQGKKAALASTNSPVTPSAGSTEARPPSPSSTLTEDHIRYCL